MAVIESSMPQIVKADQAKKVATKEKKATKNKDLEKTRLCVYFLQGKCGYGSNCTFAHEAAEVKSVPDLKKTQLCARFAEGKCTNRNCTYAHGEAELKDPPNFKKKICKWHAKGGCKNGASCGFAHDIKELRAEVPAGFEPMKSKVPLKPGLTKIAPPPGLTHPDEDDDVSTGVPSTESQAESDTSKADAQQVLPEEHMFRFMAGRGAAPVNQQVALMSSAIGGLQAKLSQLQDMMLHQQVAQMQQQIAQLSKQCAALESGMAASGFPQPPVAPATFNRRLNSKATPFKPVAPADYHSDDSTSVGSFD